MAQHDEIETNKRHKLLVGMAKHTLPILGYAICGVALGYGVQYGRVKYQAHRNAVKFAAQEVHQGDFGALVSTYGHGNPIMVTLKGCPHCKDAREWLRPRGIKVTEVPINSNKVVAAVRKKYHAYGTPTLITDSELIYGFEPDAWSAALTH